MHIWLKHSRPMNSQQVHKETKAELERLGLATTEVHPMPGRCLRRPFGQDYATITNEGLLTPWQHQTSFFEFVAETRRLIWSPGRCWRRFENSGGCGRTAVTPGKRLILERSLPNTGTKSRM